MKIGELAKMTQTSVETIRFYEREGLLPVAQRTDSNYRTYAQSHVETLQFIRRCRGLDMALEEIRTLLQFRDQPARDCSEVNDLLDTHIGHVVLRIKELRGLEKQLREIRSSCGASLDAQHCGILQELAGDGRNSFQDARAMAAHIHGTHGLLPKKR